MCNACEVAIAEAVERLLKSIEEGKLVINGEEFSYENASASVKQEIPARVR